MSRKQPTANQRGGVRKVSNDIIERLNRVDPGLGTLLANEINHDRTVTNERFQAAAGQRGTVTIAPQKRPSTGKVPPAIDVKGGQIVGGSWATEGDAFITLAQLRTFFTCERFAGHPSGFPGWFEECVEDQSSTTAGGVMPYFFGWTVHVPPDADTLVIDPFAGENVIRLWSFVLPEPAVVDRVSYYMESFAFTAIPPTINIGLYDADFNLVFETGGLDVSDPNNPTATEDGAFTQELGQEYSLTSGEYFLAFACGVCMRMVGIATNSNAFALLDHAEVQDRGLTTPEPYGLRAFEFNVTIAGDDPTYPYDAFPATIDASGGTFWSLYEDHADVPMILFEGVKAHYDPD